MQEFRPTFADSSIRYKIQLRLQVSLDRYSVLVHVMLYIRNFDSYSVPKVLISYTCMRVLSYKIKCLILIAYNYDRCSDRYRYLRCCGDISQWLWDWMISCKGRDDDYDKVRGGKIVK